MATTMHTERVLDNNGQSREIEVFVFKGPGPSKRKSPKEENQTVSQNHAAPATMSMESMRHDIRTLGIKGFSGRTKIEAKLSQLKSLGAKIPKNWERKMQRKKKNEDFQRSRQDKKAGVKTKRKADPNKKRVDKSQKKKTDKDDGVFFDAKIGTYKRGVQYISKTDIATIRNSASKR